MKFLHLSDLHFHGADDQNKEALRLLEYVRATYPGHRLIITGDLADDGDPGQFRRVVEALRPFKGRLHLVPGNHDYGRVGNLFRPECVRDFDEIVCKELEIGGAFGEKRPLVHALVDGSTKVLLIGLNSSLYTTHPFDFACGEIGAAQLQELDAILGAPTSRHFVKVVYFHHHPFIRANPFLQLKDAEALMRTIYMRADALLFGHRHESSQWLEFGGVQAILAADDSPGKATVRELEVDPEGWVKVQSVSTGL
ncbi:MAG: metallophosphoesterase [Nannocystaceae bacterium]